MVIPDVRQLLCAVATLLGVLLCVASVHAHSGAFEVRSSAPDGGTLSIGPPPDGKFEMVQTVCSAGQCTYANNELAFLTPATDLPAQSLFALKAGTLIRIELVAADPGVSLQLGASRLDASGESAVMGRATTMHAHISSVATGPAGQLRDWNLTVRLTTGARGYASSVPISLTLTNAPVTTTTTTSSTSTTVPTPECGNGLVEGVEQCDRGLEPWVTGRACTNTCEWLACGDADGNGARAASDALFVLRVVVGVHSCDACLCNVDGVGATVNSADALRLLRFAVGTAGVELDCGVCQ